MSACNVAVKKAEDKKKDLVAADTISVKLEEVSNVAQMPVEMNESAAHGKLFVTDVTGKIWVMKNDSMIPRPFFDKYGNRYKPSLSSSIGRLYSVALHPQFAINHKFYVCYVAPPNEDNKTPTLTVSQFTTDVVDTEKADISSEKKIIEVPGLTASYNGAQIRFGPDGDLYISIGDDKAEDSTYKYEAQNLHYLGGKILRIDVNQLPYSIPKDNPFVNIKDARPEIWAYGFRKLWHYSFDPVSHELIGGDVGQEREEEIDIVKKGGNYGWPEKEGDSTFQKNDPHSSTPFTEPVYTYTHMKGICVIGGGFYYGKDLPQLTNKYIFADINGSLFALDKNEKEKWTCVPVRIVNKPSKTFYICGYFEDAAHELFVMGMLLDKEKTKGVIYKVVKA